MLIMDDILNGYYSPNDVSNHVTKDLNDFELKMEWLFYL